MLAMANLKKNKENIIKEKYSPSLYFWQEKKVQMYSPTEGFTTKQFT